MKKFIALLLAVLMMASVLAACGGGNTNSGTSSDAGSDSGKSGQASDPFAGQTDIQLKVWADTKVTALTEELCNKFKEQYPDKNIQIEVVAQGENDVTSQLLNDPETAADVFSFPSDQLTNLTTAKVIAEVFDEYRADVESRNSESSVQAATLDGQLWAFPETGDNGYYLVYDKRVVSDEDAKTLEGILEACRKAGKKFIMDAGNGFYSCVFPFTGGMKLEGIKDDVQQFNDYNEDEVVAAMAAFATLMHEYSDVFESNSDNKIASGMDSAAGTCAAGIDGTWNAAAVEQALGENFGAAKLPTIKVNGEDKQMISLHGYKYIGVKEQSKFLEVAELLADFLTNEEAQIKRAEEVSWGPCNIKAAQSEVVTKKPAVAAVLAQAEFSVPQVNMAATFWTPMANLGNELYKGDKYDTETVRTLLQKTVANIKDE